MPDYPIERTLRQVPSAVGSLLRQIGAMRTSPTPDAADEMYRARHDEFPASSNPLERVAGRVVGAMGLVPLPDESKSDFVDTVWGDPSKWFPTPGLVRRATAGPPKDVNLPDEQPETTARWRQFAQERR